MRYSFTRWIPGDPFNKSETVTFDAEGVSSADIDKMRAYYEATGVVVVLHPPGEHTDTFDPSLE